MSVCCSYLLIGRLLATGDWQKEINNTNTKTELKLEKKGKMITKRKNFSFLGKMSSSWFDLMIELGWTWPLRITTTTTTKPKTKTKLTTSRKRTNWLLQLNYVRDKLSGRKGNIMMLVFMVLLSVLFIIILINVTVNNSSNIFIIAIDIFVIE